jgi:hypothetical protein
VKLAPKAENDTLSKTMEATVRRAGDLKQKRSTGKR